MDDEYEDYFDDDDDDDADGAEHDDDRVQDVLKRLGARRFQLVKRKAVKAKKLEIERNPRARSARLRCLERIL
jgi:16S rRNA C1402 N4-methylase RsmH